MARRIAHLPAWVFHGAADPVVPLTRSAQMVEALALAGGEPRFTVYPDARHDSWTRTYDDPQLYEWLLSHTRPATRRRG
jgi:dipeptidyl aminopeptidase/acylaminoacyl peptidase